MNAHGPPPSASFERYLPLVSTCPAHVDGSCAGPEIRHRLACKRRKCLPGFANAFTVRLRICALPLDSHRKHVELCCRRDGNDNEPAQISNRQWVVTRTSRCSVDVRSLPNTPLLSRAAPKSKLDLERDSVKQTREDSRDPREKLHANCSRSREHVALEFEHLRARWMPVHPRTGRWLSKINSQRGSLVRHRRRAP